MTPVHRPHSRILSALRWPMSWLLDRNSDVSTSKVMAFAILIAFVAGKAIPVSVVIALLATSFGYSMFKDLVGKSTFANTASDSVKLELTRTEQRTDQRTEQIQHTITEQRGPTGEALRSLPPVADATTPGGAP